MFWNRGLLVSFILFVNVLLFFMNIFILIAFIFTSSRYNFHMNVEMMGFHNSKVLHSIIYGFVGIVTAVSLMGLIASLNEGSLWCMRLYSILVNILMVALVFVVCAWITLMIYVLLTLKMRIVAEFRDYGGELATNTSSILFNVVFVAFHTCGLDHPNDFKAYRVKGSTVPGFESHTYPLTCCKDLVDRIVDPYEAMTIEKWQKMVDQDRDYFNECDSNPNLDGAYPVFKKYVKKFFLLALALLMILWGILSLLACSARNVAKMDKQWSQLNKTEATKLFDKHKKSVKKKHNIPG